MANSDDPVLNERLAAVEQALAALNASERLARLEAAVQSLPPREQLDRMEAQLGALTQALSQGVAAPAPPVPPSVSLSKDAAGEAHPAAAPGSTNAPVQPPAQAGTPPVGVIKTNGAPAPDGNAALSPSGPTPVPPPGGWPGAAPGAAPAKFANDVSAETWVTRIGIGLLLFGVAFLFKYSVDQGWLNDTTKTLLGLALGSGLLAFGWRKRTERVVFSRLLMGGGLGTLHLSVYAAHHYFHMLGVGTAFASATLVNLLAIGLGWWGRSAALTLMGLAGAYGAPFALTVEPTSTNAMAWYLAGVTAAAAPSIWIRGHRWVLVGAALGGGLGAITIWLIHGYDTRIPDSERFSLQFLLFTLILVAGFLPSLRLSRGPLPGLDVDDARQPETTLKQELEAVRSDAVWSAMAVPALALALMLHVAGLPINGTQPGLFFLVPALVFAACTELLRDREGKANSGFGSGAGVLIIVAALVLADDGLRSAFLLTAAALIHAGARRWKLDGLVSIGHLTCVMVLAVGMWSIDESWLDRNAARDHILVADIWALLMAATIAFVQRDRAMQGVYGVPAHLGLLWLTHVHVSPMPGGNALTSVLWAVIATIALVLGLRLKVGAARAMGLTTLGLLVVKLLLFDLADLAAVWRVLLFMGLGAALVGLGYLLPALENMGRKEGDAP